MMPSVLNSLKSVSAVSNAQKDLEKLKKATDGLEAYMFKTLLQTSGGNKGLFPTKMPGGEIYRDMFETNLSDILASRGTLGIGNTIYKKVAPVVISQFQQKQMQEMARLNNNQIENKK